ncbi:MAG: DUF302 domain-containing protein [Leptolyngbyaceae bacterium]|nr:DUF302 domain-containing protein [Leptolyngbyaceae bacterium]
MILFGQPCVRRSWAIAPFFATGFSIAGLSLLFSSPAFALIPSDLLNHSAHQAETIRQTIRQTNVFGSKANPDSRTEVESGVEPEAEAAIPDAGLVVMASPYSVEETGDRFEAVLAERGVTVFARIDHAAGAAGVDLELRPTEVIIFGNPRVGTPLMQCAQSMAIDLPQKLLIWQNEAGDVYLGYNDPRYLAARHGIVGCEEAIARVEQVLMGLTNAVVDGEVEE